MSNEDFAYYIYWLNFSNQKIISLPFVIILLYPQLVFGVFNTDLAFARLGYEEWNSKLLCSCLGTQWSGVCLKEHILALKYCETASVNVGYQ